MIYVNDVHLETNEKCKGKNNISKFPDGTPNIKFDFSKIELKDNNIVVTWEFDNMEELIFLSFIKMKLDSLYPLSSKTLIMPYIPNARQDRVKSINDVHTMKYFGELLNNLHFTRVLTLDAHSSVSTAVINQIVNFMPTTYVIDVVDKINDPNLIMFYPDEGAMKRYHDEINRPFAFGIKDRDWETGKINKIDIHGEDVEGKNILIVDDISSYGGTFYYSSKRLKELGANDIYLYVTHCENSILDGDLISSDLVKKIFTTPSIFRKSHEKIEVLSKWNPNCIY